MYVTDQFGNIIKTEGALIPVNYQHLDGDFPWICPVRSCRTMHPTIKALGLHFSVRHSVPYTLAAPWVTHLHANRD